jgi:peptide/nickel transport system substrate-binding protein
MDRTKGRQHPCSVMWVAVLTALALFTAACGNDDETAVGDEPDTTVSDDGTPDAVLDRSAVLRWGEPKDITSWDGHRASVSQDNQILFTTYDRLVHQDAEGELVPGLATDWNFAEDGSYLELTLREGVTFHDGEPFDAEAVKANIERGKSLEDSAVQGELSPIEEVEVIDDRTVRLHLDRPAGNLPNVLTDRPGIMISPAAFDNPDLDTNPVGAGMYRVTDYRPGASITFEAYEDYWDEDAQLLAGIEYLILPDETTRMNALRSGQIDATVLTPGQTEQAESAGFVVQASATLEVHYVVINHGKAPLDQVEVRQAINHAIDRQALVDGVLFGNGQPAWQMFPEGDAAFNPEVVDYYPYDPDRARELLAEAGVAEGDINLQLMDLAGTPLVNQANQVLQAQLGEVGINVEIVPVERTEVVATFYQNQVGDLLQGPWGGRPSAEQVFALIYQRDGFLNPGGHLVNEEFEEAFDRAQRATTAEEREEALQAATLAVTEQGNSAPLFFPYTPLVHVERVVGLEKYVSGKIEFRGVGMRPE